MKAIYGILVLFVVALFVGACSDAGDSGTPETGNMEQTQEQGSNEQTTENIPETTQESTSGSIPMSEIYNYAMIHSFTYESTTTVSGETMTSTMDYTLSSDTVNGKAAWLSEANIETQGATVMTKVWSDKTTYGCLKMTSVVSFNGQNMETPAECPKEGPNAQTTATETPMVDYMGDETVTVPLGTFNTKKYSLDGTITYYYASNVPLPVKVTYANADTVMELVKWS